MRSTFLTGLFGFFFFLLGSAQDCGCSISQVIANNVEPCTATVGTVVTVATTEALQSAIAEANSSGGDRTILIEDGVYPVASTASYPYLTASNLVIRSLSGNRDAVVITGQGMADVAPGTEIGFYLVGDNITIADLTIRDVGNHAIAMTGDGHLIHNVLIQDTFEQMIKGNSAGDGSDNCIVQCSKFEYTAEIGPQWYIGGLDIHEGDNWEVHDNAFFHIASPSFALAEHAIHFWDGSANNRVERNVIVNCDRGIGFGLGDSGNVGGQIINNMIFNDGSHPFHDVGIGLESSPESEVYHNTVMVEYQNAIEYRWTATTDADIINNLTNKPISSRNGGEANVENNLESALTSWFLSPQSGNLRLFEEVGEVVNQGLDLTATVSDDIDQHPRPASFASDLGAHEFDFGIGVSNDQNLEEVRLVRQQGASSFSIQTKSDVAYSVQVYSMGGKRIFAADQVQDIQLDTYASGMYLIHFVTGKERKTWKIFVD